MEAIKANKFSNLKNNTNLALNKKGCLPTFYFDALLPQDFPGSNTVQTKFLKLV